MSKIILAITVLAIFCAASCNAEVLVLKSPQELSDAIAAYPLLVVKFYAPWFVRVLFNSPLLIYIAGAVTASTWNLLGTPRAKHFMRPAPASNSPKSMPVIQPTRVLAVCTVSEATRL